MAFIGTVKIKDQAVSLSLISEIQEWVYCPVCGNKTRLRLREDTVLTHFPLFCPKCKKESLIDAKEYVVKEIK
jgi:Zn finger protein HypA/HybF involved in hydrogenase expression